MSLVLLGIDEAGYGPTLGPLCVGAAALRLEHWHEGDPAPDLWALLASAVCRSPTDARGRIPVEDSKRLKLANDAGAGAGGAWAAVLDAGADGDTARPPAARSATARHPLQHLERGVLAFARCAATPMQPAIFNDADLLAALGAAPPADLAPWYAGPPIALPIAGEHARAATGIDANRLAAAMTASGVTVADLACRVVPEAEFNAEVLRSRSKATTTCLGLSDHLGRAWRRFGQADAAGLCSLRVVLDRQGGRTAYAQFLSDLLAPHAGPGGVTARALEESPAQARYEISGTGPDGAPRRMIVLVRPKAESGCLPVALASMCAKLTRELLMARLNRTFRARARAVGMPELKPTAGYATDARRWLRDARPLLTDRERQGLVRIA